MRFHVKAVEQVTQINKISYKPETQLEFETETVTTEKYTSMSDNYQIIDKKDNSTVKEFTEMNKALKLVKLLNERPEKVKEFERHGIESIESDINKVEV